MEGIVAHTRVTSKLMTALSAGYALRTNDDFYVICFIDPPCDKKIVVLSATADEWLYRQLFGDRLKAFYDIGPVESKGNVVQYHSRSFSRSCMSGLKGLDGFLDKCHPNAYRITFKKHRDSLEADLHFGATTGLNAYAGQDCVVIGTPHTHTVQHRLMAAVCGHITGENDATMVHQQVERNGLRFWFYTYRDEILRNITLHLIETELIQAVGRSRLLRHDCTVTVYSNFPIPGAEYRKLTNEEIEQMSRTGESAAITTPDTVIERATGEMQPLTMTVPAVQEVPMRNGFQNRLHVRTVGTHRFPISIGP